MTQSATIEQWLESGGSDAFVVGESPPVQFQRLVETVIPILRRRGSFRSEYEGRTFREILGLGGARKPLHPCQTPARRDLSVLAAFSRRNRRDPDFYFPTRAAH